MFIVQCTESGRVECFFLLMTFVSYMYYFHRKLMLTLRKQRPVFFFNVLVRMWLILINVFLSLADSRDCSSSDL